MKTTPVTIFSGYLGSGKTTIILNALKKYPSAHTFALIKNEFGDASIDGSLGTLQNLAVKELVNGCLCCVLVGSLNDAVNELILKAHPERIIIEASGNALPFPIILELKKNKSVYLDGVISVVDCLNFEKVKDTSMVAREQAKHTDLIIFNKTNLVDEDKLYRVKEEIFGINPDTVKYDTSDGMVDPRLLFGIDHFDEIDATDHETHTHDLETFTYESLSLLDLEKVKAVLQACSAQTFFRVKGIIHCTDGSIQLVNGVFGKYTFETLNIDDKTSRIIFIGKGILKSQALVIDYLTKAVEESIV